MINKTSPLICSVAPGEPSYFHPAIKNNELAKPVWYTSKKKAETMPEEHQYELSYKFNYKMAIISALIVAAVCFVTIKK